MLTLLSLLASLTLQAAPQSVELANQPASIEFLAIGRPSLLKIHGTAKDETPLSGTVTIDGQQFSADASLALDTLDTGISLRNRHMKEKYLQTDQYPHTRLVVAPTQMGAGPQPFQGTLTLHGKTGMVKGTVERQDGGRVQLKFAVSTADYGIETPSFMGISVTDEVKVTATVDLPGPGPT